MKTLIICILFILFLPALVMGQGGVLRQNCGFDRSIEILFFDFDAWDGRYVDPTEVDSLLALDGRSFWRGYDHPQPWAMPERFELKYQFIWSDWEVITIEYSEETPDVYYVRAYDFNIGDQEDDHPCLALAMNAATVDALLQPQ